MIPELSSFAARLRGLISEMSREDREDRNEKVPSPASRSSRDPSDQEFSRLARELFALQFQHNPAYRKICEARNRTPQTVTDWTQIPAVPTSAFKELELSSLSPAERTAVFHSSGTTEQKPSRHFHCADSLAVYETSLWENFKLQIPNFKSPGIGGDKLAIGNWQLAILTPPPKDVPRSSLVHMFEIIRQKSAQPEAAFVGCLDAHGAWTLNFEATLAALLENPQSAICNPKLILGTAFSFVHLLDYLAQKNLSFTLPAGTRVMETGGYKNRSRVLPKAELHALIGEHFGVPRENIFCEYGMSELSSQAYDVAPDKSQVPQTHGASCSPSPATRHFHFPPWARGQIISPETGHEVADGETGLIRIFDLANVFSVAAVQTEDLGIRRGDGFELLGRAQLAEPRGCSLMNA